MRDVRAITEAREVFAKICSQQDELQECVKFLQECSTEMEYDLSIVRKQAQEADISHRLAENISQHFIEATAALYEENRQLTQALKHAYTIFPWDNGDQSDLEHCESSTSDMDSGDDRTWMLNMWMMLEVCGQHWKSVDNTGSLWMTWEDVDDTGGSMIQRHPGHPKAFRRIPDTPRRCQNGRPPPTPPALMERPRPSRRQYHVTDALQHLALRVMFCSSSSSATLSKSLHQLFFV
ncbi:hypothetical protein BU17DRAFT_101257 [Hysterangium stoloniferum]|nr:hypothetical protein BU17DRAFT_101257 [Hysterangium stoloniferum]